MFNTIRNLILVGLGINKIALEKIDSILSQKIHKETKSEDLVEEFLGSSAPKKAKSKKQKASKEN